MYSTYVCTHVQPHWGAKPHHYEGTGDGDEILFVVLPLWQELLVGYPHNDEEGKGDERGQEGVPVGLVPVWYQI